MKGLAEMGSARKGERHPVRFDLNRYGLETYDEKQIRNEDTAFATINIGRILSNAVKINELKTRGKELRSHVLAGIGMKGEDAYITRSTV